MCIRDSVETVSGGKAYWFRMDENGELVGGISKFVNPIKEKVVEALGPVSYTHLKRLSRP